MGKQLLYAMTTKLKYVTLSFVKSVLFKFREIPFYNFIAQISLNRKYYYTFKTCLSQKFPSMTFTFDLVHIVLPSIYQDSIRPAFVIVSVIWNANKYWIEFEHLTYHRHFSTKSEKPLMHTNCKQHLHIVLPSWTWDLSHKRRINMGKMKYQTFFDVYLHPLLCLHDWSKIRSQRDCALWFQLWFAH